MFASSICLPVIYTLIKGNVLLNIVGHILYSVDLMIAIMFSDRTKCYLNTRTLICNFPSNCLIT